MIPKMQEEMIQYIISNLGDAVCVTDRRGVLLFSNPAAEELFGLSSNHDTKHKIWEYIPFVETNDDLIQLFIEAIDSRQSARQMLVRYENNQGKIFHFRISLSFKEEYDGIFIVIISDL